MTTPSFRDVEQISALLDDKLPQAEAARLRVRIISDPELSAIYLQLTQTRNLLRKLPARRAPRNFTLTPKMAGIKAPVPRSFPIFRLASAFASLLLVLTFAANGLGSLAANAPAAPFYGVGGGGDPMEAPAAEARPQSGGGGDPEMSAPAATEAPMAAAPAPEATQLLTADSALPTEEAMRSMAAEATALPEAPAPKTGGETANQPPAVEPAPQPAPLVPGWLQIGLLLLALLTGGAAWFVNWQANARLNRRTRQ